MSAISVSKLIAQIVFSGLLAGAENDIEIQALSDESICYSDDMRRSISAEELSSELSYLVAGHLSQFPDSELKLCASAGITHFQAECSNCFCAAAIAAAYLNKLEYASSLTDRIEYKYACRMGFPLYQEVINSDSDSWNNKISLYMPDNMMIPYYSTLQNTVAEPPAFPLGGVCGIYEREPLTANGCDGGLRTKGIYKKDTDELPLITYVTTTLNRVDVLQRCMESVFTQDYPNIEYIVVDGASTDGTLELIRQYEDKIDYYVSQSDTGLYNAMNRGLKLASGRFVCFMNSDDNCLPGAASTVARVFQETGADVISGTRMIRSITGAVTNGDSYERFHLKNCALVYTYMVHQALYAGRRAFEEIGYLREDYKIISDFIFECHVLNKPSIKTVFINERLCVFTRTGVSVTTKDLVVTEWSRYIHETFPYVSIKDAELFYVYLRVYGLPRYRYCDLYTLSKVAKKYFKYPEFKRAFYEAAMVYCYQYCVIMEKWLKFSDDWVTPSFLNGYPVNNPIMLCNALADTLENICLQDDVSISDSDIDELCDFQRDIIVATHRFAYSSNKKVCNKIKLFIHYTTAYFASRSNRITLKSIKKIIKI